MPGDYCVNSGRLWSILGLKRESFNNLKGQANLEDAGMEKNAKIYFVYECIDRVVTFYRAEIRNLREKERGYQKQLASAGSVDADATEKSLRRIEYERKLESLKHDKLKTQERDSVPIAAVEDMIEQHGGNVASILQSKLAKLQKLKVTEAQRRLFQEFTDEVLAELARLDIKTSMKTFEQLAPELYPFEEEKDG